MTPLPGSFTVDLDQSLRTYRDETVLVGGFPPRILTLTPAGREAFVSLRSGNLDREATRRLARRLIDNGMAHPRPRQESPQPGVTVVIPTRDRATMLDRCLARMATSARVVVVDDGSHDPATVADVCAKHGAELLPLASNQGPAAARNAGLSIAQTELLAFVDADCIPRPGWLTELGRHFADPRLGAVAPRIAPVSPVSRSTRLATITERLSPLDMGPDPGLVGPGRRIPWVPTAALVVRRAALTRGFDPELKCGEDVDLVWRLQDEGWDVRYEPDIVVDHEEPGTYAGLLRRRYRYGTSVGPLARRHPRRLPHIRLDSQTSAATIALALARRYRAAALMAVVHHFLSRPRRVTGVSDGPGFASLVETGAGLARTTVSLGRAMTMFAAPELVVALMQRRTRRAAAVLLLAPPLAASLREPAPGRRIALAVFRVADDVAYGSGVLRGCIRSRTIAPIVPEFARPREIFHE